MSGVIRRLVVLGKTEGQPTLLNLRVRIIRDLVVRVNKGENRGVNLAVKLEECRVEDSLQV